MTLGACTPLYSPPQILERIPYTQKCDVWSTGMILYEMIMGKEYFNHVKTYSVLLKQVNKFKSQSFRVQYPEQYHKNWSYFTNRMLKYDEQKRISFKQLVDQFNKLKKQMLHDLHLKYDINIQQEESLRQTRENFSKLNPYVSQISKRCDPQTKIYQQKSYVKLLKVEKYLNFFIMKNDFLSRLTKVFSTTSLVQIKSVYKYILMFLEICIFISRITELLMSLKSNKVTVDDQTIDGQYLINIHSKQLKQMILQFQTKQYNYVSKYKQILQKQIIPKIKQKSQKMQEQKLLSQQINKLQEYISDAQKETFVKGKHYIELYEKIMNLPTNILNENKLEIMKTNDIRAYCYMRIIGYIDLYIPDCLYNNEDFIRIKKQEIQNMTKIQLIGFIKNYNKKEATNISKLCEQKNKKMVGKYKEI